MNDAFTIRSSALPEDTRVVGFRGEEGISRPYAFEIHFTVRRDEMADEFDPADAVGARATLVMDHEDGRPPFQFHGVLSAVDLVHELGDRTLVHAVLVPRLARLAQTQHSRIFTNMTIPDILRAILEESGLPSDDIVFRLSGRYEVEAHVCQYRESNLDFISRWMEREGIYYWFEQAEGREILILADDRGFHTELLEQPVRYYPLTGEDATAEEALNTFRSRHVSLPAGVRLKDYDYGRPTLDVSATAHVSRSGLGEISTYGERVFSPEAAERLARIRAEELKAREVVYRGSGTAMYLRSGYTFKLEGHARASFDAKYLVTELEHCGNQGATTQELCKLTGLDADEGYRVEVRAIPAATQFRPTRRAEWPRIYGHENGIVDGPADSPYAQIDEQGRYAVKFMFDESALGGGKASTWVRMMQPHGGSVEGWHFPLRKGTEVVFTFLGGDPDRPVIAGVVPNALTPSAVVTGNKTTNVIQTGGRNRLEMEDAAGNERITLSTPQANTMIRMGAPEEAHALTITTDGATKQHAGMDLDITVGQNRSEHVTGTSTVNVDGAYAFTGASETRTIRGDGRHNIEGDEVENVDGNFSYSIEKSFYVRSGNAIGIEYSEQAPESLPPIMEAKTITIKCGDSLMRLKHDGTVVVSGKKKEESFPVSKWKRVGLARETFFNKFATGVADEKIVGIGLGVAGVDAKFAALALAAIGMKLDFAGFGYSVSGARFDFGRFKCSKYLKDIDTKELTLHSSALFIVDSAASKVGAVVAGGVGVAAIAGALVAGGVISDK